MWHIWSSTTDWTVFFRVRAEYITLMLVEVIGGLGWSLTNYILLVTEDSTTIEYKAIKSCSNYVGILTRCFSNATPFRTPDAVHHSKSDR